VNIGALTTQIIQDVAGDKLKGLAGNRNRDWTSALWQILKDIARKNHLQLHPKDRPYKGEYLVDFVLFDGGRGPIFACESQLWFWRRDIKGHLSDIDWAFDKLMGVKSNVKMLLFEYEFESDGRLPKRLSSKFEAYLLSYERHVIGEHYLFVQVSGGDSRVFEWKATRTSGHKKIAFTALSLS
jgi:hypothetical protein